MKNWKTRFKQSFSQFVSDEAGQSTTEYILILAVVVMIAMKFKGKMDSTMGSGMDKLNGKINGAFDDIH